LFIVNIFREAKNPGYFFSSKEVLFRRSTKRDCCSAALLQRSHARANFTRMTYQPIPPGSGPLPYRDSKPVGAADFYLAINATFRFIYEKMGIVGLRRYWSELGRNYFAPVTQRWKSRGLAGVTEYWQAFFAAEPGAQVEFTQTADSVALEVKVCPAIHHLRQHQRTILPCFCQHCYFVSEAMAEPAGLTVRVSGGNGSCRQTFFRRDAGVPEQQLAEIREAL
jgi:hypothetical protein